MKLLLILLLTASAVGAQDTSRWFRDSAHADSQSAAYIRSWQPYTHMRSYPYGRPLSDSAILCQPYFDLAIPDDIKNSVLWMFCDSIKYVVSANLSSQISTDIVYFTYYGAMTYWQYQTNECPDYKPGNLSHCAVNHPYRWEYGLTDWHTPFAVLWERKVMWSRE